MIDYVAMGERIRQARLARGLTQQTLATAIGVTRAHLTSAEGGNAHLALDKLSQVAIETETTVATLLGDTGLIDPLENTLLVAFREINRQDQESVIRITKTLKVNFSKKI